MSEPVNTNAATRPSADRPARRETLRVVLPYGVLAALWIYFSDDVVSRLVSNPAHYPYWSTVKGWGFVVVTSALLWILVFRLLHRLYAAQVAVEESEERFRASFDQAAVGMALVSPQGSWLQANRRLRDILGYAAEELSALRFQDITHPDDLDADLENVRRLLAGEVQSYTREKRYLRKGGDAVWVSLTVGLKRHADGRPKFFVSVIEDISERRQMESALRESEERFRRLARLTPLPLCFVNRDGAIAYLNDRFVEVFGYTYDDIPTLSEWWRLACPDEPYRKWAISTWESTVGGVTAKDADGRPTEYRVTRKDGTARVVEISGITIGHSVLAAFIDVTDRTRVEQRLKDSLEEKVALLKEVHHRVKNNLQIVASLLNLQAARARSREAVDVLHDMRDRVRAMSLLHEALYRSGNLARINFAAYVEELCRQLKRSFGAAAARVNVENRVSRIGLPLERAVPCGLIINELVSNALKHAFPEDRCGTVALELGSSGARELVLRVTDDGVGLPQGLVPEDSSTLGLKLVSNLAQQLGGQVAVEAQSSGTTFRVTFPLSEGMQTEADA